MWVLEDFGLYRLYGLDGLYGLYGLYFFRGLVCGLGGRGWCSLEEGVILGFFYLVRF